MNVRTYIESTAWNILPACCFNPKEGDLTLGGDQFCKLTKSPPLGYADQTSYTVFNDHRFYMRHLYHKLLDFLPKEFKVIDAPNGQNCFMYSMGIDPRKSKKFGRGAFNQTLEEEGYTCIDFKKTKPQEGDIIVYSVDDWIDSVREHAAIYMGDGMVRSRWGYHSPLIEHPLKAVLSTYWNRNLDYLDIERKEQ